MKGEFTKERIKALERENAGLRAELDRLRELKRPKKTANWIARAADRAEAMPRAQTLTRPR